MFVNSRFLRKKANNHTDVTLQYLEKHDTAVHEKDKNYVDKLSNKRKVKKLDSMLKSK